MGARDAVGSGTDGRPPRTFTQGVRVVWGAGVPWRALDWRWTLATAFLALPLIHTTVLLFAGRYSIPLYPPLVPLSIAGFAVAVAARTTVSVLTDVRRAGRTSRVLRLEPWHGGVVVATTVTVSAVWLIVLVMAGLMGLIMLIMQLILVVLAVLVGGLIVSLLLSPFFPSFAYYSGMVFSWLLAYFLVLLRSIAGAIDRSRDRRSSARPVERGASSHYNIDGRPKVDYPTEHSAWIAAEQYTMDRGGLMNAYRCEEGAHWHIGHAN